MKFVDGLMIHSGDSIRSYIDTATRHVLLRQGVLGIKVKIMMPWDPSGKSGPKQPLPDHVSVLEPKEETTPRASASKSVLAEAAALTAALANTTLGTEPTTPATAAAVVDAIADAPWT
jgi:small subunit ribosomal protein S3e